MYNYTLPGTKLTSLKSTIKERTQEADAQDEQNTKDENVELSD